MDLGGVADPVAVAAAAVIDRRRRVAVEQFELAEACLVYADARVAAGRAEVSPEGPGRCRPGEFVADELAAMVRQQPWPIRCLLTRSRRLRSGLPAVWEAFSRGEVDAEQVVMIDRLARRATRPATLAAIDDQAVEAAQSRSAKQLGSWLLRLVVGLEPDAFAHRHRQALADRKVSVAQGPDGIGYVTGEMTAQDAAEVDALLSAAARGLGAEDPRTEQQRRADVFTDLLLGRLRFTEPEPPEGPTEHPGPGSADDSGSWVEVEDVDPDTGELLRVRREWVDADGVAMDVPDGGLAFVRPPQTRRIGVVVPLSSLLGLTAAPGQLVDRSGCVPGEELRRTIADLLEVDAEEPSRGDQVLFTRLLTDDGGRLLDVTELGRSASRRLAEAIRIRAGTCRFPMCTVPAERCDLDHHDPHPHGPTSGRNEDPDCRRHHRGKTFAWLASARDGDTVCWTLPDENTYRVVDDALPTGRIAPQGSATAG